MIIFRHGQMKTFSLIDELRYYAFLHFWCHLISKWIRARSTTLSTTTLTALRSSAVLPENMLLRPKRSAFQRLFPIIRKNSGLPCVFATGWRRFAASFPDYVLRGRTAASDPWNIHEHRAFDQRKSFLTNQLTIYTKSWIQIPPSARNG